MFKYDSTHGRYKGTVTHDGKKLIVDGQAIAVHQWYVSLVLPVQFSSLVVSVVVLEESPCPRGFSRTNLQVLVLGPQVLVLVLGDSDHTVLENCQGLCILQIESGMYVQIESGMYVQIESGMYDHMVHKFGFRCRI